MRSKGVLALAIGVALLGNSSLTVWAARKYYPPGFTPPTDQSLTPAVTPAPVESVKPTVIIQPVPGGKQVIIKTVPVTVEKTVTVQAKPKDPLMVLMDERRFFDALRMVDARLKKMPNNLNLQLVRAKILREQGSFGKAIEQYGNIQDKNHGKNARAEALNGLGWTYYQRALHERQMGNMGAANASLRSADMAFRQAAHLVPSKAYVWAGLGEVALANGQVHDAEVWVKKARKLSPGNLSVQLAEADLLLAQHKPEEALQVLYGIKKTTTREPDVYMLLARASLEEGKVDDAIINLKQLLELQPDHTEALKLLSLSYERKMKHEDAEVALEKAISLNPLDEKSVNALLKIYQQRHETERCILVLRTLLKDHPGHPAYSLSLLRILAAAGRWDEVYEAGSGIVTAVLGASPGTITGPQDAAAAQEALSQKEDIVELFARSVYQQGRSMLDRRPLLNSPAVQEAETFAHVNLDRASRLAGPFSGQSLQGRLSLLLIDPLQSISPLPTNMQPQGQDLPMAIQIAFLQGDHVRHDRWVALSKGLGDNLALSRTLYELGDYDGATTLLDAYLAQYPNSGEAKLLRRRISEDRAALQENLEILGMLPRKIPDNYWRKTASEVLELGITNGKAHGTLGEELNKRHQPALALMQLRMAAKYATTTDQQQRWSRRADKTARYLSRNK